MKTSTASALPVRVTRAPLSSQAAEFLAEDFGCFRDGYTDNDINRVLPRWSEALELDLGAVWAFRDGVGFGGDSDMHVFHFNALGNRRGYALPEGLWPFWQGETPNGVRALPDLAQKVWWVRGIWDAACVRGGAKATGRLRVYDGECNYALAARAG